MKSITVSEKIDKPASSVFFDSTKGLLYVSFGTILRAIRLDLIPRADFESSEDIVDFSVSQGGAVVVCHHTDGQETWLPVDMWRPGGFTPPSIETRGRKKKRFLPDFALALIEKRQKAGLTQAQAARIAELPPRTLQEWEQGRQQPSPERISKFLETIQLAPQATSYKKYPKRRTRSR